MSDILQRYPNCHLLAQTPQLHAMHTIIRDHHASPQDFVFYANRIIRLLLEDALNLLPYDDKTVKTPVGADYVGLASPTKLCAVPVIRAGESMEMELRAMIPGIPVGKILIQRDKTTKLPHLVKMHK